MARDYIKVDTANNAATMSKALVNYKNTLASALQQGDAILANMNHNQDGAVFTDIQTLYGLPAGKGQQVFDLINGSIGAMRGTFQNTDCVTLTTILGT